MSRHRAEGGPSERSVAIWPFVVVGAVLVLLLGWLAWSWTGDILARRLQAQLAGCSEGDAVLTVAVTPAMAGVVGRAADTWTRSRPVVQDHCVRTEVAGLPPQSVLDALTAGWDSDKLGARPGAWLPESSLWINRLSAQDARLLGSQPTSIATSPVVLAMPELAAQAVESSGLRWQDLPALVAEPAGWQRFGHPEWGRFSLAMPDVARNPASALALQSVLASTNPAGVGPGASPVAGPIVGPVTVETLGAPAVNDAMIRLATTMSPQVPGTTLDALKALAAADVATTPFDAVPTLEFDLYLRNTGLDGQPAPAEALAGMPVGGPTPTADFPFVAIAGDQVQVRAAQKFREFLQSQDQRQELSKAGLRVPGSQLRPDRAPGIRWSDSQNELTGADANTTQQISAAWTNAGGTGQIVTVLLDVSKSMADDGGGGRSKLDWAKATLDGQINRFGSGSLGLWVFSSNLTPDGLPYRRLVPTAPVNNQHDELAGAVAGIGPAADSHLYPSLLAVYRQALIEHQPGRINRVVVITDGRNDAPTMHYEVFKPQLDKLAGGTVALPISVVAIGSEIDRDQLTEISRVTGGTFNNPDDGSGIEAAFGQLLSAG
jgi:Ca-activated chloride channel homolog